ncbi:alpha/beta fold hydrolase [Kutzneria kofuensis]|uniref:Pimeloyl-ACP methyl ester carboxylesterase n=1 Tax=Kutzneria kofuensis TaxID=103725 RepID=A0A7W9NHV8_9PSEU|nr:alpha/beta hydrolase [Kutzneria kofuensis]MBB5893932.1 pimeloyl-ACP methyl ester carboxylesterase [Kutzneria kofuensis]
MDTKTRGDGPLLLLLHGGGGDVTSFDAVLDILAEHYTVVTYTQCDGGPVERADEAARLLADLGASKASVFASSAGAMVALDLVARHPERVGLLVAHEPPVVSLLPDADELLQAFHDLVGKPDSGVRFVRLTGVLGPVDESMVLAAGEHMRVDANMGTYLGWQPDLAAIRDGEVKVVLAAGKQVAGSIPFRTAEAVADAVGAPMVIFPGNHFGYAPLPGVNDPAAFGRTLVDLLRSQLSR